MKASKGAITAVVLAGGEDGDAMAADAGVEAKALVPVGGKPMGAYVLEALRGCGAIGRIVYVGPVNVRLRGLYDVAVPAGRRLVDSLALGVGAALGQAPGARLLVLTADIPWVTSDGLAAFVAALPDADLVYPAVTEVASRAQFPHQRRTYVRLREGRLTGGNAVLIAPAAVPKLLPLIDAAFRARKNPVALARLFGLDVLLSLLLGRAAIGQLERRLERMSGIRARALVTEDAALAADVDRPGHLPGALDERRPGLPGANA
jgi:molybdopterin-guanine dinucleotide biosynthesis protein A